MLKGFKDNNEDATALVESYIALYNDCLSARPSDLPVGVHLCRGNFVGSRHFSEGGYLVMVMDVMGTTRFGIARHLGARCGKRSSCSFDWIL
jgi:methionine synthase II (cobalamin-independent)